MVKIRSKRQQILPCRNIAVEARMRVRQLQVRASGAAKRAGNLAAHGELESAIARATSGKESDYSASGGIHAAKSCPRLWCKTKQRRRVSTKKLRARIEAVGGKIHNARAGNSGQIAGHR